MADKDKQAYQELEESFADYVGTRYAVSVNNGTNALTLALGALGVGPGDEVIIPDYTMVACAWAVTYLGARPVFVDCDFNLGIKPEFIEEKITARTKALMPVHIYGRVCQMDKIMDIALKHNLYVVEDCAEAHGAEWKGQKVGSIGDIGCFSLYRNKIIQSEEGGICVTNSKVLADRMNHLKNMCFDAEQSYMHDRIGWNMRMANSLAKIAVEELKELDQRLEKRKKIAKVFDKYLEDFTLPRNEGDVYWVYDLHVDNRDAIYQEVKSEGIDVRYGFKPMSYQPMYFNLFGVSPNSLALNVANSCFYLYMPHTMTLKRAGEIGKKVAEIIEKHERTKDEEGNPRRLTGGERGGADSPKTLGEVLYPQEPGEHQ